MTDSTITIYEPVSTIALNEVVNNVTIVEVVEQTTVNETTGNITISEVVNQVTLQNVVSNITIQETVNTITISSNTVLGGSGGGTWGTITGTLSDQADLQAALNAKLSNTLAANKIWVGNGSNVATAVTMSGDASLSIAGVLVVAAQAITFGKMQNINTGKLLGRSTAGAGSPEEISLDASLAMASGVLGDAKITANVAAAGSTQATATQLTGDQSLQVVTVSSNLQGVKLPASTLKSRITIVNLSTSFYIYVYPATGANINLTGTNQPIRLAPNSVATFFGRHALQWDTLPKLGNGVASADLISALAAKAGFAFPYVYTPYGTAVANSPSDQLYLYGDGRVTPVYVGSNQIIFSLDPAATATAIMPYLTVSDFTRGKALAMQTGLQLNEQYNNLPR